MKRPPLRIGYGLRLGAGHVLLALAVGGVVLLLIDRGLREDLLRDLDLRLELQARGAAAWATEGKHPERLAARLGGITGTHVTIIGADGKVLGDSTDGVVLGSDEAGEPEVSEALAGRTGRATRGRTRYVAISVPSGGVLRLGASLGANDATVHQVRARLAVASFIGIAVAIALAVVAARWAACPLRNMRDAAHRIAEGDYSVSLPGTTPDEFGELERSLSVLATRLAADRERIERLERTRRDFVANLSHELRTPVTAIQGYSETLLTGAADPATARRFLETMHRQSRRIGALVTDLLTLAEMEARPRGTAPLESVRVADVAREAAATVREKRADAPEIVIDVPADLIVKASPRALEQVLENLLENAVRYGTNRDAEGRPSTEVRVEAPSTAGARVAVVVRDFGAGIPSEHVPRIFERFHRVDAARSRSEGGTGLGLAIVKHLVESMGGIVSVESAVGRGSAFRVELDGV
jgi:signal transduction histidine kinase